MPPASPLPSRSNRHRHHPPSPLSLANLTLKDIEPQYLDNDSPLNLGADTPVSLSSSLSSSPTGRESPSYFQPATGSLKRSISSSSLSSLGKQCFVRPGVDRDCKICYEPAVMANRMSCCGAIFCFEHINTWVYGSNSNGRCPSCRTQLTEPVLKRRTLQIRIPTPRNPLARPRNRSRSPRSTVDQILAIQSEIRPSVANKLKIVLKPQHIGKILRAVYRETNLDVMSILLILVLSVLVISVFLG